MGIKLSLGRGLCVEESFNIVFAFQLCFQPALLISTLGVCLVVVIFLIMTSDCKDIEAVVKYQFWMYSRSCETG